MKITADAARRLFAAERAVVLGTVGVVGTVGADATAGADAGAGAVPHLVPVTFAVDPGAGPDADLVLTAVDDKPKRTTDLRRLRNIAANPAVCLLADRYDDDWSRLWWARADGKARVVERDEVPADLLDLLHARYAHYAARPPRGPFILVEVAAWSGWSFANDPMGPSRLR